MLDRQIQNMTIGSFGEDDLALKKIYVDIEFIFQELYTNQNISRV